MGAIATKKHLKFAVGLHAPKLREINKSKDTLSNTESFQMFWMADCLRHELQRHQRNLNWRFDWTKIWNKTSLKYMWLFVCISTRWKTLESSTCHECCRPSRGLILNHDFACIFPSRMLRRFDHFANSTCLKDSPPVFVIFNIYCDVSQVSLGNSE